MAVLFLAGPMDKNQAQGVLQSQIFQKINDLGSDTHAESVRTKIKTELKWIADHGERLGVAFERT